MPRASVNGVTLYYERRGTGPPLLLSLGLGSEVASYSWLVDELARHYDVVAYDHRGSGRSAKPRSDYRVETMTQDLIALMDHLSIGAADVVGISLGTRIALDLAARFPERVTRLMLVSALGPRLEGYSMSPTLRLAFCAQWLPRPARHRQPWHSYRAQHRAALDYDGIAAARLVRAPTQILHARGDRTTSFRGAVALKQAIPGSRLHAFAGGHLFFRGEGRDAFVRVLVETAAARA